MTVSVRRRTSQCARPTPPATLLRLALLLVAMAGRPALAALDDVSAATTFDEAWTIVHESFVDPDFNGVDWEAMREKYRPQFVQAHTDEGRSEVINAMLDELGTSHTAHLRAARPEYYELMAIYGLLFNPRNEVINRVHAAPMWPSVEYDTIGVRTTRIEGRHFVKGIFAGSPAERAGVRVGDELVSADGQPYHPHLAFAGKSKQTVALDVQSGPEPGSRRVIDVMPERVEPVAALLEAADASARVIKRDGQLLGYIRLWSLAGHEPHQLLRKHLFDGQLVGADGLVLDLRDGWGGSCYGYLELFTDNRPRITMRRRDGMSGAANDRWLGPLVLLINEGSRSAKETVAYSLQHYAGATLVGTCTAGAVTGGTPHQLSDGSLLIVATTEFEIDGQNLEGRGVAPDIVVEFPLEYAAGRDPQLEAALDALAAKIDARRDAGGLEGSADAP